MPDSETVLKNDFGDCVYKIAGDEGDLSVFHPLMAASGRWEPEIGRVMSRLIEPTDICLDVGANIGLFTLLMSDFAARGRVHAFEPNARTFKFLERNLRDNQRANTESYDIGLSDHTGDGSFTSFDSIPGTSFSETFADDDVARRRAIFEVLNYDFSFQRSTVSFTTLDAWAKENHVDKIDFVKLDVEGNEPAVVRGGLQLFIRSKCKLITEINTKALKIYGGIEPSEYFNLLTEIFPYIYVIEERQLILVFEYNDVIDRLTPERFWTNLLCLHEDILCYPVGSRVVSSPEPRLPKCASRRETALIRTLYFTVVPISWTGNGGSLVCRNHIRELAAAEGVHLTVAIFGAPEYAKENKAFVESIGADYIQLESHPSPEAERRGGLAQSLLHVQERAASTCYVPDPIWKELSDRHDVVVIDWMMSAFYATGLLKQQIPKVMITLNPEGSYYEKELRDACGRLNLTQRLSVARMKRKEKRIYASMQAVIALNEHDLPTNSGSRRSMVLRPLLKDRSSRWSPKDRSVAFVGNIAHPPNRRAIEWLCTRLADELACRAPEVMIKIVGASADTVEAGWRRPNVEFLGIADRSVVTSLLKTVYLFLAPIDNDYGSKIKVLECLAHGTPFLATSGAESGVPFLRFPKAKIDLKAPDRAAQSIVTLINCPESLQDMSCQNTKDLENFRKKQQGMLGNLLKEVVTAHKH